MSNDNNNTTPSVQAISNSPESNNIDQPAGGGNGAQRSRHGALQPRTTEDIAREHTIEQFAVRIWAATVAERTLRGMSALLDELVQEKSHLLDDDDEEQDEGWIDDRRKRESELLDDGIKYGLEEYPTIETINNLETPPPNVVQAAEQLKRVLTECPIGATKFAEKFSRAQLQRMVRRDLKERFEKDTKYRQHLREDVPGSDVRQYGSSGRTSSKGTFARSDDFESGGGLAALFTGGWMRVAKDRIDPYAWSHEYGPQRKTERKNWRQVFQITEKDGSKSVLEIPRQKLAGNGGTAIKLLMKAGIHLVHRNLATTKAFMRFLRFKPKLEINRMPQTGWYEVDGHWLYVRSNETLLPRALRESKRPVAYVIDHAHDPDQYGNQIMGTTKQWQDTIAVPLRGNSNIALAFATSFASALIPFGDEQRGGAHLYCITTGIGKTLIIAAGEAIYGLPAASQHPRSYGRTWGITPTGLEDLLRFRNHASFFLDELQRVPRDNRAEAIQMVYAFTQAEKARGGSWRLKNDGAGQVFLLSSGEQSLATFLGSEDREGRVRRMPDIPALIQETGTGFEMIGRDVKDEVLPRLYTTMIKHCHGAPGRDWQKWLVELGPAKIKALIEAEQEAFLALPQVKDINRRALSQMRSIIRRFGFYAASLRMAIASGILPWTVEEADAGLIACLERWVTTSGNFDPAVEQQRIMAEIERKIVGELADRFIDIRKVKGRLAPATAADAVKQKTPNAFDGYVKGDHILIRPEAWNRRCAGHDPVEIARRLQQRGSLIADDKRGTLSKTEQVIGKSDRFYVLVRAALASG
jgi:uncharacterized protein (DUF927 family)